MQIQFFVNNSIPRCMKDGRFVCCAMLMLMSADDSPSNRLR